MKEATNFQKSIVKQIEKIGDEINLIEGMCKDIEELDPILISKIDGEWNYTQPIINFIINHRRYTIWYNEMRDSLFKDLTNGAYIIKNDI